MSNFTVCKHPLIDHKIALLRDKRTGHKEFRELVSEITMLMTYESMREVPTKQVEVETPLEKTMQTMLADKSILIIPILRAGLGMVEGFLNILPNIHVGYLGMARDEETLQPREYYANITSEAHKKTVFILDPMLATGGSASAAITYLKKQGVTRIKLMSVIAAPEGVKRVHSEHPDVDIFTASLDRCLNEKGYILPGLGDAGDRLFS